MTSKAVDLFAGIGGFHAALSALDIETIYASEWDGSAAATYSRNWRLEPKGDITELANDERMDVPAHQVLTGGFPCQPFSKSGKQKGESESRGTLFWNIEQIIIKRHPKIVLLENVRNLAGPKHIETFNKIIGILKREGYLVASEPLIVSPHKIHPKFGGSPQIRERLFIAATLADTKVAAEGGLNVTQLDLSHLSENWDPQNWSLSDFLGLPESAKPAPVSVPKFVVTAKGSERNEKIRQPNESSNTSNFKDLALSSEEITWIDAWDKFVKLFRDRNKPIPGFPLWSQYWGADAPMKIMDSDPSWKKAFITKNTEFYAKNEELLSNWLEKSGVRDFPPTRQKFEWQAQDENSLWKCIMHFRPSGIRAKKATYVPTLVAINQTTVYGPGRRRLSVSECAKLQQMPQWFDFANQSPAAAYKQLGNGVNVAVVYHVLKALVTRDQEHFKGQHLGLKTSILSSPDKPSVKKPKQ
jgi:DNA (cytosine-5)-methyltransferase 1